MNAWTEQITITRPDAVALLADRRAVRFLVPFLRGPRTLTEAAAEVDRPVSTVAYWVPRLVRAGLVEEVDRRERAGRPMRVYRAVAQRLLVPVGSVPLDARVTFLDAGRHRLMRRFLDGVDEELSRWDDAGLRFEAAPGGGLAVNLQPPSSVPARAEWTEGWLVLDLDPDDAAELVAELDALVSRYVGRSGRRRYLVHAGVVREPRHRWRSAADT